MIQSTVTNFVHRILILDLTESIDKRVVWFMSEIIKIRRRENGEFQHPVAENFHSSGANLVQIDIIVMHR